MSETLKIAVDAMGSDLGPNAILKGALQYLQKHEGNGVKLFLIGKQEVMVKGWTTLLKLKKSDYPIEFVDASEVVGMDESFAKGMKKRNSSLAIALRMHKTGQVNAVVSAGNTGVFMAQGVRTLGSLRGVSRPAIASPFPTLREKGVIVLDVGANVDCTPKQLFEFGIMGSIYSAHVNQISRPTVGLLSIGEEKIKGNNSTLSAYRLFENSALNFIGNVEGNDILSGKCDVVITDGFTGNILLKFGESVKTYLFSNVKKQVASNLFSRAGVILLTPFLKRMRNAFDPSKYGGAPLLGVDGVMIISHGASSPRAVKNAIRVAERMVKHSVNSHIQDKLTSENLMEKAQL